ncbi:unnamed protein product [Pleuronectes platessa]|uniref:Uncharacterized protein n=1 Tax=Pleuronectes platessa TaxID=8262 RepID=A0A9N7TWH0_PLEPL|nr:unnamed protein product [Pleuronectes platessa]
MGTCRGWGSSRSVALLSAPPEAQCAAPEVLIRWHLTASLVRGLSFSWTTGRCPLPARKAGRWRGLGTRSAAATLDACRALLADPLSYGNCLGNPLFTRGGGHPPAVRLGWRLAAD